VLPVPIPELGEVGHAMHGVYDFLFQSYY
jgi:hypothetical protein